MVVGARWATFVSSFCTAPPRAGAWLANAPPPWFVGVQGTALEASDVVWAERRGVERTELCWELGSAWSGRADRTKIGVGQRKLTCLRYLHIHIGPLASFLSGLTRGG